MICSNQCDLSEMLNLNESTQKTCRIPYHYGKRSQKWSTHMSILSMRLPYSLFQCWTMPFICGPCAWMAIWRSFHKCSCTIRLVFPSVSQENNLYNPHIFMNLKILLFPSHTLDILCSVALTSVCYLFLTNLIIHGGVQRAYCDPEQFSGHLEG